VYVAVVEDVVRIGEDVVRIAEDVVWIVEDVVRIAAEDVVRLIEVVRTGGQVHHIVGDY
jgi:hypothetical protein